MIELIIVLLVIAIACVLALPQIMSSRRLFRFSSVQKDVVSVLRESRQEAMTQRTPITFRYDDSDKTLSIYGGTLGPTGDSRNRVYFLTGNGLVFDDVVFGRPAGVSIAALGDGTNLSALSSNVLDIAFQADGSVIDGSNIPQNKAIFFYNVQMPDETAFAVSVLGAGGRAKVWRYSRGINAYVE